MPKKLTAKSFHCPECGARPGRACKGSRIPGANTLGGGWGGPPDRKRPHDARYEVSRAAKSPDLQPREEEEGTHA